MEARFRESIEWVGLLTGSIQLCEVINAPNGKCPFIIFYRAEGESCFYEFETAADAKSAFDEFQRKPAWDFESEKGFIRKVSTGAKTPWFYGFVEEFNVFRAEKTTPDFIDRPFTF